MREVIRSRPGEIILLAIGPLTNVGLLFALDPEIPRLLHQLVLGLAAYNVPLGLRMRGPLDVPVLEQCLNEIVRRHEALRTTFSTVNGRPVQVVADDVPIPVAVEDLTDVPEGKRENQARQRIVREAARPMNLIRGPLVRARLFKLGESDHVLLLVVHHMVFDGWSREILYRELATLYEAFSKQLPSPLPELPVQFADFTLWQRERLQGKTLDRLLSYWVSKLDGMPSVLELPSDRPRPAFRTFDGARHSARLSGDLRQSLEAFSRGEGATLFMTLLAAFQALLFRHTGQADQVMGSPIAGRNHVQLEGMIGFLMNTLILRNDLSGDPAFRELLGRVRENTLAAYAHQDLPLQKLYDELHPPLSMSHMPLIQTVLIFQNTPGEGLGLPGLDVQPIEIDNRTSKFDLSLIVYPDPGGLTLIWEYSKDLFEPDTVERLSREYHDLLEAILANPDRPLSELPLSCESE